jgi:hypothetical protein
MIVSLFNKLLLSICAKTIICNQWRIQKISEGMAVYPGATIVKNRFSKPIRGSVNRLFRFCQGKIKLRAGWRSLNRLLLDSLMFVTPEEMTPDSRIKL